MQNRDVSPIYETAYSLPQPTTGGAVNQYAELDEFNVGQTCDGGDDDDGDDDDDDDDAVTELKTARDLVSDSHGDTDQPYSIQDPLSACSVSCSAVIMEENILYESIDDK